MRQAAVTDPDASLSRPRVEARASVPPTVLLIVIQRNSRAGLTRYGVDQ